MPIAEFRMPDGKIAEFRVPEGTTPEQAQAMIADFDFSTIQLPQFGGQAQAQVQPQPDSVAMQLARPVMVAGKGLAKGVIGGIADTARAATDFPRAVIAKGVEAAGFPEAAYDIAPPAQYPSEQIGQLIDKASGGITKPRNELERVSQRATEFAASGLLPSAALQGVGKAPTVARGVLESQAAVKPSQAAALAGAGAGMESGQIASEKGYGGALAPALPLVGALAGGTLGGMSGGRIDKSMGFPTMDKPQGGGLVRKALLGKDGKRIDKDLLETAIQEGVELPIDVITTSPIIRAQASNLQQSRYGQGVWKSVIDKMDSSFSDAYSRALDSVSAKKAQSRQSLGLDIKNKIDARDKAYNRLIPMIYNKAKQYNPMPDESFLSKAQQIQDELDDVSMNILRKSDEGIITKNPEIQKIAYDIQESRVAPDDIVSLYKAARTSAGKEPTRLSTFVRKLGGVRTDYEKFDSYKGEMARLSEGTTGLVNNKRRELSQSQLRTAFQGQNIDDIAQKAQEAGYFPEITNRRVEVNEFLEALENDLWRQPRYSAFDNGDLYADTLAGKEDAYRQLEEISLNTDTQLQKVRRAIKEIQAAKGAKIANPATAEEIRLLKQQEKALQAQAQNAQKTISSIFVKANRSIAYAEKVMQDLQKSRAPVESKVSNYISETVGNLQKGRITPEEAINTLASISGEVSPDMKGASKFIRGLRGALKRDLADYAKEHPEFKPVIDAANQTFANRQEIIGNSVVDLLRNKAAPEDIIAVINSPSDLKMLERALGKNGKKIYDQLRRQKIEDILQDTVFNEKNTPQYGKFRGKIEENRVAQNEFMRALAGDEAYENFENLRKIAAGIEEARSGRNVSNSGTIVLDRGLEASSMGMIFGGIATGNPLMAIAGGGLLATPYAASKVLTSPKIMQQARKTLVSAKRADKSLFNQNIQVLIKMIANPEDNNPPTIKETTP